MLKKIFLTMLLLVTFIFGGCVTQGKVEDETHVEAAQDSEGNLKISMLNIGQGDSLLIQTGKQTILVDTARFKNHGLLVRELEKLSVTKIDKLILTHSHADHIGGARMLINPTQEQLTKYPYLEKISVAKVYDNGVVYTSPSYKSLMETVNEKKIERKSLKAGDTLDFGGGVKFKVLFPTKDFVEYVNSKPLDKNDKEHNINNGSLVAKLTYKNFSMMFTGDCEKESEAKILESYDTKDLKCDVLKAGHHGLMTSSTKKFVSAINPSCVLISASNAEKDDVAMGAPRLKVLENYLAAGVEKKNIFCTRFNGTITITSDGKNFSVAPEEKEDWVDKWMEHKRKTQQK